ncbi:MAG: hypothetical protein A3J38_02210 [Gammaproteobacteria bacterium RIFCSPHIGHO2_12_FULL_45_9]|nr:MAG: hypothetical protein A3J38_02210 [Gammaproteobacteria bacterium RIFCSPHIGHO2_12_FULL_45_9]
MKHKIIAALILLLMLVGQIGTDVYLASLPAIHVALQTSLRQVQYTFSVFLAGFAVSQLCYGPLSDRYGRRPLILWGLMLYSVAGLWCFLSTHIAELLFARVLQGVGAGACTVVARAIMRDVFDGKDLDKINIYQSMVWSMVPISAPLIGSYIQQYLGWRYNFLFLVLISVTLLLACWFKLPETHQTRESVLHIKNILDDYKNILCHQQFIAYLLFCTCIVSLFAIFNVSAPLIIQILFKQSVVVYGWSVLSVAITFTVGSLISRVLTRQLSSKKLMLLGVSIIVLADLAWMLINTRGQSSLYTFLMPFMLIQIGSAFAFPSAAAESMRLYTQKSGKVAAIFGCTLFLGSAISSGIMSRLPVTNLIPFSIMLTVLIVMMVLAYVLILKYAQTVHDSGGNTDDH